MKTPNNPKIQLETKKVMAYVKNPKYDDDYEIFKCHHCGEEYLSQGCLESEELFCPIHSKHKICVWCDETDTKENMVEEDEQWYCKGCFSPKCLQCEEPTQGGGGQFCSKQCHDEYWGDVMEDDYKDR